MEYCVRPWIYGVALPTKILMPPAGCVSLWGGCCVGEVSKTKCFKSGSLLQIRLFKINL